MTDIYFVIFTQASTMICKNPLTTASFLFLSLSGPTKFPAQKSCREDLDSNSLNAFASGRDTSDFFSLILDIVFKFQCSIPPPRLTNSSIVRFTPE